MYVDGSTACPYDCPHHFSPLYFAEQCYDKIPVIYFGTVMYVGPITRQTFVYANQVPCENNPLNVISLDPDTDQYYVLTSQPIEKGPPLHFEPTQIQTDISPNTFTAQYADISSQKNSNIFGTVYYLPNTPIILFSSLVKLIAIVTAACPYPALRLDKLYAALIRCLVLWTVTKQFLVFVF